MGRRAERSSLLFTHTLRSTDVNIGPTQPVPVAAGDRPPESSGRAAPATPSLGDRSRVEPSDEETQEPAAVITPEVVKVHSDTSSGSSILVYDFVDARSGSVVFQIPSDQMLNLVQDIRQRLQRMTASQSVGRK